MVEQKRPLRTKALRKKLLRDLRSGGMQFAALLLLCALATWVFAGLDANWRNMDLSFEEFFSRGNLTDLWVKGAYITREDLSRIGQIPGVEGLVPRASHELDCPDFGDDVSCMLHAYDGDMSLNSPMLQEGSLLAAGDTRGILVEEQFANAHHLAVGDVLTLRTEAGDHHFTVRGKVLSPEYIVTAKDVSPNPALYGFALCYWTAVPELVQNDVLVRTRQDADISAIQQAIEEQIPGALVISQATQSAVMQARGFRKLFQSLSYVFPVIAYGVAAMIVISTLRRMIGNQRLQIGTLRSLGYSDRQIRRHYLAYALVPSLIGSFGGMVLGVYTLPRVIWEMVCVNLRVPTMLRAPISPLSWAAAALTVLLSLYICLHSYNAAARECTAELLRPVPPKSGVRILLEGVPWLWGRFTFNMKMVVRNILRNKGRTAMSMVGMLVCNALIVCSFGLQESIPSFIAEYYSKTLTYDVRADLAPALSGTLSSYQARLPAGEVSGVMEISASLHSATNTRATLVCVIPEGSTLIRIGPENTVWDLPEEGVVLSKKLAEIMAVQPGDRVSLLLTGDDVPLRLPVQAIADVNIGQTVYISKTAWERCRKLPFRPTALLIADPTARCTHLLSEMDEVVGCKYPAEQIASTNRLMDATTTAFTILSFVALGLAFIICYNMGLMNFTERTRDYATLKVLGYHQREIKRIMMRENDLVSVVAVGLGIWPGITLVEIILHMVEMESMVFVSAIGWKSIAGACAITFLFSRCIEWLLTRKVPGIDMVEALKSVE